MKTIFLAGPYSGTTEQIEYRVKVIASVAAHLMKEGHAVICPILMGHEITKHSDIKPDWKNWSRMCEALMEKCDEMMVLRVDGWDKSEGVAGEMKILEKHPNIHLTFWDI